MFNQALCKHKIVWKRREEKMKLEKAESKPSCISESRFLMLMKKYYNVLTKNEMR